MSGHSKWAKIRRAKDGADQKRGAIFSKLAKAITVSAKEGGTDESTNFKLRLAVSKAKQANMPKDNIKRAIDSGAGGTGGDDYKEDVYEGYGPAGSALIIETLSNNVNRTIAEIKHTLAKYNGKLAQKNSALRLFEKVGLITITKDVVESKGKDNIELTLIDLGASDIEEHDEGITGIFPFTMFNQAADAMTKNDIPAETEILTRSFTSVTLSEKERETFEKLIDMLEELEDVETVSTNVENI